MGRTIVARTIAVVSLGSIGRRHVRTLSYRVPKIRIVAVRSRRVPRYPEEGLVAEVFESNEAAIRNGADAAIICSPASQHASDALAFLSEDLPVLIEKPLSNSLREAKELGGKVRHERKILLGYLFRYSEGFRYLQKQLLAGWLGDIKRARFVSSSFLPEWRPGQDYRTTVSASRELGGGALLELSHELDMALSMFGPFESVRAQLGNSGTLQISVEDYANLSLRSAHGVDVSVDLDFSSKTSCRFVEIQGTTGRIRWDLIENSLVVKDFLKGKSRIQFADKRDHLFARQLDHFFQLIEEEPAMPLVGSADGIAVLELVEAAHNSAQCGHEVLL